MQWIAISQGSVHFEQIFPPPKMAELVSAHPMGHVSAHADAPWPWCPPCAVGRPAGRLSPRGRHSTGAGRWAGLTGKRTDLFFEGADHFVDVHFPEVVLDPVQLPVGGRDALVALLPDRLRDDGADKGGAARPDRVNSPGPRGRVGTALDSRRRAGLSPKGGGGERRGSWVHSSTP